MSWFSLGQSIEFRHLKEPLAGDGMSKTILTAVIILAVAAAAGCRRVHEAVPVHAVPGSVPESYQMIYRELDAEFHRQLPLVPLPWEQTNSPDKVHNTIKKH